MRDLNAGPSADASLRSVRVRYLILLAIGALSIVLACVGVHLGASARLERLASLEDGGGLRVLLFDSASLAHAIADARGPERARLAEALDANAGEISRAPQMLLDAGPNGSIELPDDVRAELTAAAPRLTAFAEAARRVAASAHANGAPAAADLALVTDRAELSGLRDALTRAAAHTRENDEQALARLRQLELVLVVAGVAALFMLGAGVIEPLVRRVRREYERLRDSGLYMRAVVDSALDGIVSVDDLGTIESFNPAAERMFGYPAHEVLGFKIHMIVGDLDLAQAAAARGPRSLTGRRRDGSELPLDIAVAKARFAERELFVCTLRDATERERAERAVRDSDAHKGAILAAAADPIVSIDADGRIGDFNPAAERAFGFQRSQVVGAEFADVLVPRPQRSAFRRKLRDVAEAQTSTATSAATASELPLLRHDGSEIVAALSLVRTETGTAPRIVAHVRDLSERDTHRAQELELEARIEAFAAAVPDALIEVDELRRVQSINPAGERLFGWRREEILGRGIGELLPAPYVDEHERLFQQNGSADLVGLRQDGGTFPMHVAVSSFESSGRRWFAWHARDVSAEKQTGLQLKERALELARSNAELEQFAYVAAHDLQEPLRMVASYTELLSKRYRGRLDKDADEFIAYAVDGARRMQYLINDLLNYSRVGTRAGAFEPVSLDQVVHEVLATLRFSIEEHRARVVADALPVVRADARQISQVFQNLIANALKFRSDTPPVIRITAEKSKDGWRFTVRDNGIGLDMEFAERIFVVFQRLHPRDRYPGTGVGLAICKKIVERHGGKIWVESKPGEGAAFHFTLLERPEARVAVV